MTLFEGSKKITGNYKPNVAETYPTVTFGFCYWNGYNIEGGIGHVSNFSKGSMNVQNNLGWRRNSDNTGPMTLTITIDTPGIYVVSFGVSNWGTPSTTGYLKINGTIALDFGYSGSGNINKEYKLNAGDTIYLYAAQPLKNQGYQAAGAIVKID